MPRQRREKPPGCAVILPVHWELYLMMLLPLAHFILFKYLPMFGNILAFRRFRPLTGPYGVSWVGLRYFEQFMGHG